MKKTIILASITVIAVIISFYAPTAVKTSVPVSGAVKMGTGMHAQTVSGSGQIENIDEYSVSCPVPVIISNFSVKEGDSVEAGQSVAIVDKDATKRYLYSLSTKTAGAEYSALMSAGGMTLTSMTNAIPEVLYSAKAGTISQIDAQKGEIVTPDAPILRVIGNGSLVAQISVNEADAQKVMVGQSVELKCKAVDSRTYSGTIESISPVARKKYSGTSAETVVDASVKLDDTEFLKSGYSVTSKITVTSQEQVNFIPYDVIMQDGNGEYVYILSNGKTEKRYIKTGRELSDGAEIISGLSENDIILTNTKIKKGGAVQILSGTD